MQPLEYDCFRLARLTHPRHCKRSDAISFIAGLAYAAHARLAARSAKTSPEKKTIKEEMIQWMLVWLENPGVFPAWIKLRKQKL